jgi:hypothetical protein
MNFLLAQVKMFLEVAGALLIIIEELNMTPRDSPGIILFVLKPAGLERGTLSFLIWLGNHINKNERLLKYSLFNSISSAAPKGQARNLREVFRR